MLVNRFFDPVGQRLYLRKQSVKQMDSKRKRSHRGYGGPTCMGKKIAEIQKQLNKKASSSSGLAAKNGVFQKWTGSRRLEDLVRHLPHNVA